MQRLLPPILLVITWLIMVAVHQWLPLGVAIPSKWKLFGLPMILAGLAIAVVGARLFKTVGTNIKTFDEPDKLVTTGPFAYSRNPMYLGFAFAALGVSIFLGTVTPIIVGILFCILLDRWYIQFEETKMLHTFGDDYVAYKKRVRRWL